jgi:hypothetical protein
MAKRVPSGALSSFVVDDGDRGQASGIVVLLGTRLVLVDADGAVGIDEHGSSAVSCAVAVHEDSTTRIDRFLGKSVLFKGLWKDQSLLLDEQGSVSVLSETAQTKLADVGGPDPADGPLTHLPSLRPASERLLMEEGSIMDLWEERDAVGVVHTIALATNPDRVRSVLAADRPNLEIIRSRWSPKLLEEIEALLLADDDPDDLVRGFGYDHTPDGQLQFAATLLHLPEQLAARLNQFPGEAISLKVLVAP